MSRAESLIQFCEGKQVGLLYHYTRLDNLEMIIRDDRLYSGAGQVSFTRDKNFHKESRMGIGMACRFVVDGDKLSNKYKIQPYSYYKPDSYANYHTHKEAEEVIKSDIPEFHKYVKQLQILDYFLYSIGDAGESLLERAKALFPTVTVRGFQDV